MIRRPPRSTQSRSSAASDVYKRQAAQSLTLTLCGCLSSVFVLCDARSVAAARTLSFYAQQKVSCSFVPAPHRILTTDDKTAVMVPAISASISVVVRCTWPRNVNSFRCETLTRRRRATRKLSAALCMRNYILRESKTTQNVLWSRASVCLSVCVCVCLSVRGRSHYVVISRDGRKLVTRVRVMLP